MHRRVLVLITLLPLLLLTASPAFAEWRVNIESKTVNPNETGVTVDFTFSSDVPTSVMSVPVVVREIDPGSFWTGSLPTDTVITPVRIPVGVTWDPSIPGWAVFNYEIRPGIPDVPCATDGDLGYDAVSPDHFSLAMAGFAALPAAPGGLVTTTIEFDVTGNGGQFEFDTSCFTASLSTIFMIDGAFPPSDFGSVTAFDKGIITIVGGNEAPVIACPGDPTLDIGQAMNLAITATDDGEISPLVMSVANKPAWATFTDNGGGSASLIGSPGCADVGQVTVQFIANDGELADTCDVTITVNADTEDPVITSCPPNMTVDTDAGECFATVDYAATASDNCPGVSITYSPPSGSQFFQGSPTTVTVTAEDAAGNTAQCTFNVIVEDNEKPTIACPANITTDVDPGECFATVVFPDPTTGDNCPGETFSFDPPSGTTFNQGTINAVRAYVTDANGKKDSCDFDVAVNAVPDQLAAAPPSLVFNYQIGGALPSAQTIDVTNLGCGAKPFITGVDQAWLGVSPPDAMTPATITVSVDVTGLAEGPYNGNVTLDFGPISADADGANLLVPVTLNVVGEDNLPPSITTCPFEPWMITEGDLLTFPMEASDPNQGDAVTITMELGPQGATFDGTNFSWQTGCADAGEYLVRFVASDGELADSCMVGILVADDPTAFAANPTSLTFNYFLGDPPPAGQTVDLTNLGCGEAPFMAMSTAPWASVDPTGGSTPATLTVSVDPAGLAPGPYNADIEVYEDIPGADGDIIAFLIPVTLNVTGEDNLPPSITTCPFEPIMITEGDLLTFPMDASDPNQGDAVTITMELGPPGATFDGANFSWQTGCADAGEYLVRFIASDGELTDTCMVNILVADDPVDFAANPTSLTFNYFVGDPTPPDQTVDLTNLGCGETDFWTWDSDPSWLAGDPPSGTTPTTITYSVKNLAGLAPGVYTTDIEVYEGTPGAPGADSELEPLLLIPITLNVTGGDCIVTPSPESFAFEATVGDPVNPDCQTLDLGGEFCDQANWTATWDSGWLSVDPAAGTFPGEAQVCVDIAGLPAGVYADSICIQLGPNGDDSDTPPGPVECVMVPVMLTINDRAPILALEGGIIELQVSNCEPECHASADVDVLNMGGGVLDWQANWTESFINVVPTSGTAPSTMTIEIDACGLPATAPGEPLIDSVIVTSPGAIGSPAYVIITTTVIDCPPVEQYDSVWVGSGAGGLGEEVIIAVDFFNSDIRAGLTVPLKYSGDHVLAVSGDFTGSRVDHVGTKFVTIDEVAQTICIAVIPFNDAELIPAGDRGLLVNLHFMVESTEGCPQPITVAIDSNFIPPGCEFMFVDEAANPLYPEFFPGMIEIECECRGTISGMVTDESSSPIFACAEIWSSYPDGHIIETLCFESGIFESSTWPCGTYDVRIVAEGYCPVVVRDVDNPSDMGMIMLESVPTPTPNPFVADYWGTGAMLYGDLLQPGDVVTATDPDGVVCGMAVVEVPGEILIDVYGDDSLSTPNIDEGARNGDIITFWLNCDCPLEAENPWVFHGSFEESFDFECIRTIEIPLCQPWTLMSYNVEVMDLSLESVLAGIDPNYGQVRSSTCETDATSWVRDRPLNDLSEMDNEHGYWLYTEGVDVLRITGMPIPPETPLELCADWNVISYLPNESDALLHALGSIAQELLYVYGFDCVEGAQTYDPARGPLNDLTCLKPGHGYWTKLAGEATLIYPTSGYDCPVDPGPLPKVVNLTSLVTPTPWNCDFYSFGSADGPAQGSVLTVRDQDGAICGQAVVMEDGMFLIHVYGDDPNTEYDEGAEVGSVLTFAVDDLVYEVVGSNIWTDRGSLEITLSSASSGVPSEYELYQNYPNPFNPSTTISFRLGNDAYVSLNIYNVLGQKVRTLIDREFPAGAHEVQWDGRFNSGDVAESGVYFYRLSSKDFTEVRKMTLVK